MKFSDNQSWVLFIGYLGIAITTVVYLASWTGSGHVLYFSIVLFFVSVIGVLFYLRNNVSNMIDCPSCHKEFNINRW